MSPSGPQDVYDEACRFGDELQLAVSLLGLQAHCASDAKIRHALGWAAKRMAILTGARMAMSHSDLPNLEAALRRVCSDLTILAEHRSILISLHVAQAAGAQPTGKATALALVVHEVIDDVIAHAFQGSRGGHIVVVIGCTASGDLTLTVDHDGQVLENTAATASAQSRHDLARQIMSLIGGTLLVPAIPSRLFELTVPTLNGAKEPTMAPVPRSSSPLRATQFIRSSFLSAADVDALEAIAGSPHRLAHGNDLVREDVETGNVHFLIDGWACRYKMTPAGSRQITGLIVAGDICNLDSFMLPQVNFGVRMLTAATVVSIPRLQLQRLAAERPGIARSFTWFAIMENAMLSQLALSLGRKTARERIAYLYCETASRLGAEETGATRFQLPLTQEQIGDLLGLTETHVNRTMKRLRDEGMLVVDGAQITVPQATALRHLAGFNGNYLRTAGSAGNDVDYTVT